MWLFGRACHNGDSPKVGWPPVYLARAHTHFPQALAALRQRFSSPDASPDEDTLKWYLRDRYFDVEEAEQKLRSMLKWRKAFQ